MRFRPLLTVVPTTLVALLLAGCDRPAPSASGAAATPAPATNPPPAVAAAGAEENVPNPAGPVPMPAAKAGTNAVAAPAPALVPAPEVRKVHPEIQRVVGRWLRPDGGYILDIQKVDADGHLTAEYLNPKSIHIARAEARHDGSQARVFIEFRDQNYPGSTYTLTYAPQTDQLFGVYFQAMVQESYDVMFVRQPGAP